MTYPENRPTNPNDRDNFEETINSRPATDSEVAYRDGYVSGAVNERDVQRERALIDENNQALRDNENAGRGLLLGLLLAGLLGAGALAAYLLSRPEPTPVPATNTIVVPNRSPVASPSAIEPKKETTVIERTVEKVVPAPQTSPSKVEVNAPPAPAPKVEVNVPPAPAPKVEVNVPPASPAPASPNSAAPNSASPNSAAPGVAAPDAAAPGATAPGAAAPGATGSGGTGAAGSGSN